MYFAEGLKGIRIGMQRLSLRGFEVSLPPIGHKHTILRARRTKAPQTLGILSTPLSQSGTQIDRGSNLRLSSMY